MNKTVGIIGLGIMGGAIGRNLIARGWHVIGFDIDAARRAELARGRRRHRRRHRRVGARRRNHPDQPAESGGRRGRGARDRRLRPTATDRSRTVNADHRRQARLRGDPERGRPFALDCPLSGTGAQAKTRDLVVYASGDSAAIARCMPVFADFAKQSADLGVFGNGSRMKFVANHLVAIHNVATAEAMVLAERAGLDPKMVVDMVGPGAGGSRMFQMRAPMMVERHYEPATMKVSTWKKDMAIIAEFAADVGCETPLFTLTQPVYAEALAMGLGDQDTASVFEVLHNSIITKPEQGQHKT